MKSDTLEFSSNFGSESTDKRESFFHNFEKFHDI